MTGPKRRELIPELRAQVKEAVPAPPEVVDAAIDHWRDGGDPRTPLEQGVFFLLNRIATDLDS